MTASQSAPPDPYDVAPSVSNHFAWLRTQMALQRTLMAAVRTGVSLVGFGFTVAQFFQKLQGNASESLHHLGPDAPRNLGLVLIAAGVATLTVFTWQFRTASTYLSSEAYAGIAGMPGKTMHSAAYLSAFAVILIGVAAFLTVLAKL